MPPVLVAGGLLLGAVPDVAAVPDPIPPQAVTTTAACPAGPGFNPRANPRLNRACAEVAAYLEALNRAAVRLGQRSDVALGLPAADERAALAVGLYTPVLRPAGAGRVEVTLAPRPDENARIAAMLRRPEFLDLCQRLLRDGADLLAAVRAPDPAARGGAWYRASASPPTDTSASPQTDADLEIKDRLTEQLEAVFIALSALQPGAEDWYARPDALQNLERTAAALPRSAAILLLLAEARLQHDLPQQSITACTAALRLAPELNRARYVRALAHWRLQQLALAEDDLSASLADWHGRAPQGRERAQRLQARGAVRQLRRDPAGMCADFLAACALGDCRGLAAARTQGQCLAASAMPRTGVDGDAAAGEGVAARQPIQPPDPAAQDDAAAPAAPTTPPSTTNGAAPLPDKP